jgi:hypothetical protein
MAMVVQLCVAMVHDLGLSRNSNERARKLPPSEEQSGKALNSDRISAERRAFLGTYHIATGCVADLHLKMGYTKMSLGSHKHGVSVAQCVTHDT